MAIELVAEYVRATGARCARQLAPGRSGALAAYPLELRALTRLIAERIGCGVPAYAPRHGRKKGCCLN